MYLLRDEIQEEGRSAILRNLVHIDIDMLLNFKWWHQEDSWCTPPERSKGMGWKYKQSHWQEWLVLSWSHTLGWLAWDEVDGKERGTFYWDYTVPEFNRNGKMDKQTKLRRWVQRRRRKTTTKKIGWYRRKNTTILQEGGVVS